MKSDAIFKKYLTARGDRRDYLKFSFSAFSANSAVNFYVSCSIRPAVFLAGGMKNWLNTNFALAQELSAQLSQYHHALLTPDT